LKEIIVKLGIIDPHTYLEIELNYKELLIILKKCGSYAFFGQIYNYYNSKSQGFRAIKKMIDLKILGEGKFNNNKYIYLKISALKYLKYRDFKELPSEIKVMRMPKTPNRYSFFVFEYYLKTGEILNRVFLPVPPKRCTKIYNVKKFFALGKNHNTKV
jgi:hypothetical protein